MSRQTQAGLPEQRLRGRCRCLQEADELHLTPLELIHRIAALVPPPRAHRHRDFEVLAPNSPLKAAVTALALAAPAQPANAPAEPVTAGEGSPALAAQGSAVAPTPGAVQPKRPAHNLRAVLIARIYEVFPPLCPISCGQMRSIAYITHSADIRHILNHIRALSGLPQIAPERGPPLWDERDAQVAEGIQIEPD